MNSLSDNCYVETEALGRSSLCHVKVMPIDLSQVK
jgi:hypothetical protein